MDSLDETAHSGPSLQQELAGEKPERVVGQKSKHIDCFSDFVGRRIDRHARREVLGVETLEFAQVLNIVLHLPCVRGSANRRSTARAARRIGLTVSPAIDSHALRRRKVGLCVLVAAHHQQQHGLLFLRRRVVWRKLGPLLKRIPFLSGASRRNVPGPRPLLVDDVAYVVKRRAL